MMGFAELGQTLLQKNRRLQKITDKYFVRGTDVFSGKALDERFLEKSVREQIEKRRKRDFQERIENNKKDINIRMTILLIITTMLILIGLV